MLKDMAAKKDREYLVSDDPSLFVEAVVQLKELSGLSDEQLSVLFPVEEKVFLGWRTGRGPSPSSAHVEQVMSLWRLMKDVSMRVKSVKTWLVTPLKGADGDVSPYELLKRARLMEVWNLVAELPSSVEPVFSTHNDGTRSVSTKKMPKFNLEPDYREADFSDWDDEDDKH